MNLEKFIIDSKCTIRDCMKMIDDNGHGIIIVYKNDNILGIITDGDIRRAILNEVDLSSKIKNITNTKFIYTSSEYEKYEINQIFNNSNIRHLPLVNNGKLEGLIFKEKYFKNKSKSKNGNNLSCPVVIMAGGKGKRLAPYTDKVPKPLVSIGDKAMIELIMDEFHSYGINDYFISINHMGEMIESFLSKYSQKFNIKYIREDKPLGTAGSLKYLLNNIDAPFFVSNCDIIIKEDYSKIMKYHIQGKYNLTLVASMQHQTIPYGVCSLNNNGDLLEIIEKPENDFLVNTGVYVLNPDVLDKIPSKKYYNITDLISDLLKENKKIGVFPISSQSWSDFGELDKYKINTKKILSKK